MRFAFNKPEVDCSEAEPLLWDYSTGRTSEQEALQVSRHLESCEHCRMTQNDYSLTVGALHDSKTVPNSRVTWSMIESELTVSKPPAGGFRFRWHAALATGAAALIVLVLSRANIDHDVNPGQTPMLASKGTEAPAKHNNAVADERIVSRNLPVTIKKSPAIVAEQHVTRRHKVPSTQVRITKSDSSSKTTGKKLHSDESLARVDGGTRWSPTATEYVMPDSTLTSSSMEATYVSGESLGTSTTEAQGW
jgi:hypothetical protein